MTVEISQTIFTLLNINIILSVPVVTRVPMLARLNAFLEKISKVVNVSRKKILITKLEHLRR